MDLQNIPVCEPIEKLITFLKAKNYIVIERKVSDFHFHEFYFQLETDTEILPEIIEIEKIVQLDPVTFSCKCHWSIVKTRTKDKLTLKNSVLEAIKFLPSKKLNIDNIIEYIDHKNKVKYSQKEIIDALLLISKDF